MRLWDVGGEVVPHADEWTRVKTRCLLVSSGSGSSGDRPERKAFVQDGNPYQVKGAPSMTSPDITALENTLIRGYDDDNDEDSNSVTDKSRVPSARKRKSNNTAAAAQAAAVSESSAAAAKESARCALRLLRPEILRQAGAHPAWRTGRVTAVLDRSLTDPQNSLSAAAIGTTSGRRLEARTDPLVEVCT